MFEINPRISTIAIVSAVGVFVSGFMATAWWQRRKRNQIPTKWRRVGELVELTLFPLKSAGGFDIVDAECTEVGCRTDNPIPLRDRFFAVITEKGKIKEAQQHPKMLLIKTKNADFDSITFQAPGMSDLHVTKPKGHPESKVYFTGPQAGEHTQCVDCGDDAAKWIHSFLNLKEDDQVRLGFFLEHLKRQDLACGSKASFMKMYPNMRRTDGGVFSDIAAFMLINEASLEDLRGRLGGGEPPFTTRWFRPNFVVRGPAAFEEDDWNYVRIGDSAVMQVMKPCTRCILTTIDPETGIRDSKMEPLRTLKKYRMMKDPKYQALEKAPAMGCYLGLRREGSVKLGDPIYVGH